MNNASSPHDGKGDGISWTKVPHGLAKLLRVSYRLSFDLNDQVSLTLSIPVDAVEDG
jgi:hypothetical protein